MMLPSQGPTSSLMEDLVDLGLAEEKGPVAKSVENDSLKAKKDGYAERIEVNVAADKNQVPGKALASSVEPEGEPVEETVSGKMVPSFMIPTESEVQEAEQQAQVQAEDTQLTKAWEVIHSYFAESDDGLNDDGLRGVINAMGFALNTAVEDIANLTVENTRLTEAVNELTGLLYETQDGNGDGNGNENGDDDEDEDEDEDEDKDDDKGDEDDDEEEDEENGKNKFPFLKGKQERRRERGGEDQDSKCGSECESRRQRANLNEDSSLNSLLDEIRGIGTESPKPTKAVDLQAKLIEGFEGVRDSCGDIVGRIVKVIADDQGVTEGNEPELSEDDERVKIARFFNSIAEDAATYLSRLAEGNVPFKVAEADLGKIYGDMEKGIEAMHTVE